MSTCKRTRESEQAPFLLMTVVVGAYLAVVLGAIAANFYLGLPEWLTVVLMLGAPFVFKDLPGVSRLRRGKVRGGTEKAEHAKTEAAVEQGDAADEERKEGTE